ncbi:MAG: sulfatase-like hydrolase/transferase, partial [Thermoanaerobaculales bacterium]|nr:sulfatase-like hydrolase/transferase [Thermoanaerobaculales bacterium]
RGLWDDALVIVTSDHGEEFREHGEFMHSQPYVENLAVPLMVKTHGGRNHHRPSEVVEMVDLMPSILELAGIEPPPLMQGRSVVPLLRGKSREASVALGRDKKILDRFTIRTQRYTLVHRFADGRSEFYDRAEDPTELVDIAATSPDLVAELKEELKRLVAVNAALAKTILAGEVDGQHVLSPQEQQQLRAIGYVE